MRVVSVGDLVTDYYYKNGRLLGVNGGMTSHNVIANLANMGMNTAVFGVCGNDSAGKTAIKSLNELKVDTSYVELLDNISTRCFHVSFFETDAGLIFTSKKRCPMCGRKNWYDVSLINPDKIIKTVKNDDILVFDNLNCKNQMIIDKVNSKKVLDLGQYFEFENLTDEEIISKIKSKFSIINFNERVIEYLMKRFNLIDIVEFYDLFSSALITITMGKKGVKFIYNDKIYNFPLKEAAKEIDSTGAGDSFFATIIKSWIDNNFLFDETKFDSWYDNSIKITRNVVKKIGARGHINSLYKIKSKNGRCICNDFDFVIRKKIKRCSININNLEKRAINAVRSSAVNNLYNIRFDTNDNYIFTGAGGSFAGAVFASIIINHLYGSNTYALLPRDIIYRNNSNINKVILFSYSGTTNDLIKAVSNFDATNKYIITKGEIKNIVLKTDILKENIISYRNNTNKGKERGFLSFEGTLSPASIFFDYYLIESNNDINIEEFIKTSINKWKTYFEKEFKKGNIKKLFEKGTVINIFSGDYTRSACYDIESKIIESGCISCIVHEKKNFSHGRFVNYENLNNRNSIYFKSSCSSLYEDKLLNYLDKSNILILESDYDGIFCEYDLLIASQYLIYFIGKFLDIDVSKPTYSDDALKLYFYKGMF